ncbi:Eco47II family restriction endonuclease, partial [Psittacicella gerlachiana]
DENSSNAICVLVEVIAKKSQNIPWKISINKESQNNERIRKISIDKFYEIITGDKEAFKKLCDQLIITINKIAIEKNNDNFILGNNTVLQELEEIDKDKLLALYKLAFSTYQGF